MELNLNEWDNTTPQHPNGIHALHHRNGETTIRTIVGNTYIGITLATEEANSLGQFLTKNKTHPKTTVREIAKTLARRDRKQKETLMERRRATGLKQTEIDELLGFPSGWTHELEKYDSNPTISDLRLYETAIKSKETNTI